MCPVITLLFELQVLNSYCTISPLRGVRGQKGESRIQTHASRDLTLSEKVAEECWI